jgi:hypothetical protein
MLNQSQTGQMTWKPNNMNLGILHLRNHPLEPWRPYTEFPELVVQDVPGFSAGYVTFVNLLKKKWQHI